MDLATVVRSKNSWDAAFGLQEEAKKWVQQEEERSNMSYLTPGPSYEHYVSQNGKVPPKQFQEAFVEFGNRYGGRARGFKVTTTGTKTTTVEPSVVLVATRVSEDWEPTEDMDPARFLLVPELAASKNGAALFITYMPGPEHGSIDGAFSDLLGAWRRRFPILQKYFATGQSSGGYGHFQPNRSIYPRKKFRDRAGRDIDKRKKGLAYSRLVWEVEYKNRDPVEIRQRGKRYLSNNYTRLFLAAKFYEPDENNDYKYEAAIVLWGKVTPSSNDISVVDAVSFGTIDLSDDHKNDFFEHRRDRLLGVSLDQWRQCPANESVAAASSTITIPYSGVLYKVTKEPQVGGNRPYLLDGIEDGEIEDLTIDLPYLRQQFENALDDDDEDSDDGTGD
mmetsp:Transcript_19558/g.53854  ORF Transcript_19558/g.53854 Transcript_19558/m.53854 type:complete len:391 (-) Transcript_19558:203-1375(-)|eukprot:CAMPEP_0168718714 /NCGR_PEP_ID=MMETSP0724-20121128/663_1 /TAXON_ID=265536 /ORGANISM="Amphiprora sp., Strain CCMP467" /LENGTH=390 /DNA_ID=CAMNT_0008765241 /DNA_START=60 /DNA_END=1232 /DNA_ORIENTATION=+